MCGSFPSACDMPWHILLLSRQCQIFLQTEIEFCFGLRVCRVLCIYVVLYCPWPWFKVALPCTVIFSIAKSFCWSSFPDCCIYLLIVCSLFSSLYYCTKLWSKQTQKQMSLTSSKNQSWLSLHQILITKPINLTPQSNSDLTLISLYGFLSAKLSLMWLLSW